MFQLTTAVGCTGVAASAVAAFAITDVAVCCVVWHSQSISIRQHNEQREMRDEIRRVFVCLHTLALHMKTWEARTIARVLEKRNTYTQSESDDRIEHRPWAKRSHALFTVVHCALVLMLLLLLCFFFYSVQFLVIRLLSVQYELLFYALLLVVCRSLALFYPLGLSFSIHFISSLWHLYEHLVGWVYACENASVCVRMMDTNSLWVQSNSV